MLTELMLRDDVPVPVRPVEDGIEVHATEAQHAAFEAFLKLIHPKAKKHKAEKAKKVRSEWLEAFRSGARVGEALRRQLASRDTDQRVQAKCEAKRDQLVALAEHARQEALAKAHAAEDCRRDCQHLAADCANVTREAELCQKQADAARKLALTLAGRAERAELKSELAAVEREAQELEMQCRHHRNQARTLDEEARCLREKAKQLAAEAEALEAKARQLEEQAAL
jgi:colicin import membrane protein